MFRGAVRSEQDARDIAMERLQKLELHPEYKDAHAVLSSVADYFPNRIFSWIILENLNGKAGDFRHNIHSAQRLETALYILTENEILVRDKDGRYGLNPKL